MKPPSRIIGRLRIIVYCLVVLFCLLIAGGNLFFRSQRSADLAVYLLTARMNELVAGHFSIAGASGNLLDGLTLHGIEIRTPQRTWLKIPEVSLRYDPLSLFIGLFHFKEVRIKNLELYAAPGRDGKGLSLPFLTAGGNDVWRAPLRGIGTVESFRLEECALYEVRLADNALTGRAVTHINLQGRSGFSLLPIPLAWSAWYSIDQGHFSVEPQALAVDFQVQKGIFNPRRFQVKGLELSTAASAIVFDLDYPWLEQGEKKLEWRSSRLALHEFLGGEEITLSVAGTLSNRPFPSLLARQDLEILENPRPMTTDTYYLKQKITRGNGWLEVLGMIGNPLQATDRMFTGTISFHNLDRRELLQAAAASGAVARSGYDPGQISTQLERAALSDHLDGSLFLDLKKGAAARAPAQINGVIQLDSFSLFGTGIRQAKTHFDLRDHTYVLDHGSIVTDTGTVRFGARRERAENDASAGKWTVHAEFDDLDLRRLSSMAKLPASLSGSGQFDLSPGRLDGRLHLAPFGYGPASFADFSSDFFYDRKGVTIRNIETALTLPAGISDNESATAPWPAAAGATSSLEQKPGARKPVLLKLSGEISNEGGMNLLLAIPDFEAALLGSGLAGAVQASVAITGGRFRPDLSADFLGQGVRGPGVTAARLGGRIKVVDLLGTPDVVYELNGEGIKVGSVAVPLFQVTARENDSSLFGLLPATGKEAEAARNLEVQRLVLHDGMQEWNLVQATALRLGGAEMAVDSFTLSAGPSSLGGHLRYGSRGEVDGAFLLKDYRLPAAIMKQIPLPLPQGQLSLDLKAHGPSGRPDLGISLIYQPDPVSAKGVSVTGREGMAAKLGSVQLQGQLVAGRMHLAGSVTLPGNTAELRLQMPLVFSLTPLKFAPEYAAMTGALRLENIRLAGLDIMGRNDYPGSFGLDLNLTPRADDRNTWLSGKISLMKTEFPLPHTDVIFTGGQGDFSYGAGKLLLRDIALNSERGKAAVSGEVVLGVKGDIERFDLQLDTERLDLIHIGPNRAVISGRAEIKGTPLSPMISGNFTLLEAMIQRPPIAVSHEHTEDVVVYSSRADVAGERAPGYFPDFASMLGSTGIDLLLDVPGHLIFDAGDLKLELQGKLHLQNNAVEGVRLRGRLTAINSEYQVAGKTFDISNGELVFEEKGRIDPGLTATAIYSNPDITITAQVHGTVNKPEVRLESEPWLSKEDIRTFILFGRSRERLRDEDTGGIQGGLAAFLGGAIFDRFKGGRDEPGLLGSLNFSSSETEAGESNLSVGKYLSDDFLLSYQYQLNTATSGQLHLEYKLKGGFSIESLMMDSEKGGLDLFWKKDF